MTNLAKIVVSLSGGCELLFGKQARHELLSVVPAGATLADLVRLLKAPQYLKERPEQFLDASGDALRPGILVLVNDVDAEVVNGMEYVLEEGDSVEFVSTLHGG
jgi:ubiquitin related modifier 1